MRKVVLGMQVSLDGYVTGPGGDLDWMWRAFDDDLRRSIVAGLATFDTHLMGRNNYLGQVARWPHATDEIAAQVNSANKIVFSRTLTGVDWENARLAADDPATEITRLKQQPGKDIAVTGGARFARTLIHQNLIDEYDLIVHPIALGGGAHLFEDLPAPLPLAPITTEHFTTGVVRHRCRPAAHG